MSMYAAECRACGFELYANTHEDAPIPGPIGTDFTTDSGDEPGFRVTECPECGSDELAVAADACPAGGRHELDRSFIAGMWFPDQCAKCGEPAPVRERQEP